MTTDNMNPLLDDLFAEARVEAPQHSFVDTKKTLLAGLAIGSFGLIGAKIISSSILKSKFFIMSISAVTILTSAVLVYTTGLNPNAQVAETSKPTTEVMAIQSPSENEVPDDLFMPIEFHEQTEVEPEDSVIVVKVDSVVDVQEIIDQVMRSINIEQLTDSIGNMMEMIHNIDIEISEGDIADIELLIEKIGSDSIKMEKLIKIATNLEEMGDEIDVQMNHMQHGANVIMLNRTVANGSKLHRKVFTITNQTTDLDLEAFNEQATAAGIDVRYDCTVWASKIKKLNMRLAINSDQGSQTTDVHIRKVKRNESFVHNIIWFENDEGQAVKFNKTNECDIERHNHDCEEN